MTKENFQCVCHLPEHNFYAEYWDEEQFLYLAVNLNTYDRWYKRLWEAVKYVFKGANCGYAEIILEPENIVRLQNIINLYQPIQVHKIPITE